MRFPRKDVDIVITAARYSSADGRVKQVQAYRRMGPVWSDILIFSRSGLIELMQSGKKVATGRRERDPGSVVILAEVQLISDRLILKGTEGAGEALGVPRY